MDGVQLVEVGVAVVAAQTVAPRQRLAALRTGVARWRTVSR